MENRRLLIAAFLSALVLIVWNYIFPPVPVSEPEGASSIEEIAENLGELPGDSSLDTPSQISDDTSTEASDTSIDTALESVSTSEPPVEQEPIQGTLEESVVLENELVRAEFTNRGGQLLSLRLKTEMNGEGGQIEMIRWRGRDPYPFALVRDGEKVHPLNKALFQAERMTSPEGDPGVTFRYRGEEGNAEKVFSLAADGLLESELKVSDRGSWGVILGPGVSNPSEQEKSGRFVERGIGYRRGEDVELLLAEKQDEETILPISGLRWIALEDNFFFAGVIPDSGVREILIRPVREEIEANPEAVRFKASTDNDDDLTAEQMLILESSGEDMHLRSLFSSKRYSVLVEQPYPFDETVRWGFFGFLAKPLYFGLEWIHSQHIANYGWAIVVITLLIRIAFFPLTWKSQKSMTKMQELNPKMQAIRNKYRSKLKDKQGRPNVEAQRLQNEEMMALYKKEGVNPASGCLPMLLQMPVFFAFYNVLARAVELRQAEWIGWIYDLSAPDPYFVLPILMTVSSFLMQRIMPSSPDPMQRRLLQFMPVAFGAFALYFPSGLVLYWFTNNLLTAGQQLLLNKVRKKQEQTA